jgi:F1F0 ATPase subunit 2
MNEAIGLILAVITGVMIGILFFGGLWWTVRRGVSSSLPELWFFFSPVVRISIALAGFYFVSGGNWLRLLLCLTGFVVARVIILRYTRSIPDSTSSTTEALHAS